MSAYRFTMAESANGADECFTRFDGMHIAATSRNGASMALARKLVDAGADDGPVAVYDRDGCLRFTAPSLHRLALLTIGERDRDGLRLQKWRPMPSFVPRGDVLDGAGAKSLPRASLSASLQRATEAAA